MLSADEEPRSSMRIVASGIGIWLLSISVLIFLFACVTPPFQAPSSLLQWILWCVPAAVAGLAFLFSWELVVNPIFMKWLRGSGEPGEAVIRMGALGIGIVIAVFLVIRIIFD